MAEPCPDRVDIDTGAKQVCRGAVADRVGADAFCRQRRSFNPCPQCMAFDQSVNAEARDWMAATIEEDMLVGWDGW